MTASDASDASRDDAAEEALVRGIGEFKIIPFIGAGISMPLGLPSWRSLITALCEVAGVPFSGDYLTDAEACENAVGRTRLIDKVREMLSLERASSDGYSTLYEILTLRPPIIYTTNYDDAIERACASTQLPHTRIVGIKDLRDAAHDARLVIKYHGDLSDPASMVLTKRDYRERLALQNPLDYRLRSDLLGKGIVFLGYGFGDPNIEEIWRRHVVLFGKDNVPPCFLVALGKNDDKKRKLEELGITVIAIEVADRNDPVEFRAWLRRLSERFFKDQVGRSVSMIGDDRPLPKRVLTRETLLSLEAALADQSIDPKKRADELRSVMDLVVIPDELVPDAKRVLFSLVEENVPKPLRAAVIHVLFNIREWEAAHAMMVLTPDDELRTPALHELDMELGELCVPVMMHYLMVCKREKEKLKLEHVSDIMQRMKCYSDTDGYQKLMESDDAKATMQYFYDQHAGLEQRMKFTGMFKLPSARKLVEQFMSHFPRSQKP